MQNVLLIIFSLLWVTSYSQFGSQNIITTEAKHPFNIFSADIDGDGNLDVLSASSNVNNIAWYKNMDGHGNFGPLNLIGPLDEAKSVYAADLDGDGDMDVMAASSYLDKVVWYENLNGQGNFSSERIISNTADGAFTVIAADIDGDGDMDAVSASDTFDIIGWYENTDGLGNFGPEKMIDNVANNGRHITAGDIDGDGDMDIIATSSGTEILTWFENTDGLGNFGPPRIINYTGYATAFVFVADIDGDNDLDILTAAPGDNEIAWYENTDGVGNFGPKHSVTTSAVLALCVFAADLDNDGDLDILAQTSADPQSGQVMWYENLDGRGNFGPQQIVTTEVKSVLSVIAADLDNDGDMDVVSASQVDDKIAWYENQTIIGIEENQLGIIKIYPNPTKGLISIASKTEKILGASVFDVSGKKVFQQSGNIQKLDISNLQSSIYFLSITTDDEAFVQKIIKE